MTRQILYLPRTERELLRLHPDDRRRVLQALERLALTNQGDVQVITGSHPTAHRLRVGKLRIILILAPTTITVANIDNRGEVYKRRR
jgi:mRNA-degrading endonuclease RelE of RelBE toxin-antitoxin system